jgi:hypothetical protein
VGSGNTWGRSYGGCSATEQTGSSIAAACSGSSGSNEVGSRRKLNRGRLRFARIPTHAIGVATERRCNPRASLSLPLRLLRVGEVAEPIPVTLVTRNISSSGVYFLAPRKFEPGTAIELEVALVERPLGQGRVQMCTAAHIVRAEELDTPGWHGYAATFDDFALRRDDVLPLRYQPS